MGYRRNCNMLPNVKLPSWQELMSWGTHGAMGELKSPPGMMALASLFLLTSGDLVLGVLAMMPWYDGVCCLVPFDLRSFGLGGARHDAPV